MMADVDGRNM